MSDIYAERFWRAIQGGDTTGYNTWLVNALRELVALPATDRNK